MMALNVSSEVLDGFGLVEGSLRTSIDNSSTRNKIVNEELEAYYQSNPEKVRSWYEKGKKVKDASDLMTEAPGLVDDKQLQELYLACVNPEA